MSRAPWWHGVLLTAFPRSYRERHGTELLSLVRARTAELRRRPPGTRAWSTVVMVVDILCAGLAERRIQARLARERDTRSRAAMTGTLLSDLRFAWRLMRKSPSFPLATMFVLALGIAANGAIFTAVRSILLQPLPYRDPGKLLMIWSDNTQAGESRNPVSPADFVDYRAKTRAFESLEAVQSFLIRSPYKDGDASDAIQAFAMTPGVFHMLGRDALYGRTLRDGDDAEIVLSYGFWQRRYGGDRSVLGRHVLVSNQPGIVVGIMPRDFLFPYQSMLGPSGFSRAQTADVYAPIVLTGPFYRNSDGTLARQVRLLAMIGRLKNGVSVGDARSEVRRVAADLAAAHADVNRGWGATVVPLLDQTVGSVRPALVLLAIAVAAVLLMACVNVANLLLSKSAARAQELAVRAALGASRGRLVQQALVESGVLAAGGAIAGAGMLTVAVRLLVRLAPPSTPRVDEIAPDATVFLFTAGVAIVAGLGVGIVPALTASRGQPHGELQHAGRGATASAAARRHRRQLIVVELALAVLLAAGAGVLLRSFLAVLDADPGFQVEQTLTFMFNLPSRLTQPQTLPAARLAFYDDLFARLEALPGVTAAGGTTRLPLGSTNVSTVLQIEGRDVPVANLPQVEFRRAVHHYFSAMGIALERGRAFTTDDKIGSTPVAIVNSIIEERYFQGQDPVGRRIRIGSSTSAPWLTIVGVIGPIRHGSLEETPRPEVYISARQNPPQSPFIAIRTSVDPASLMPAVRRELRELDPDMAVFDMRPMSALRDDAISSRRFVLLLTSAFGIVALVLAAVGVYGVMALGVSERRAEIGVRLAMGARPSQILGLVLGDAARVSAVGIAIGLALALALLPLIASQLYGVRPFDVPTLSTAAAVLLAVALAAAYGPARRATRVDPLVALRP